MQNILLIEDDLHWNSYISENLKFNLTSSSIDLHSFTDFSEFLKQTESNYKYDIIILDLAIYDRTDSNQIIERVKDLARNSKVILYSNHALENYNRISNDNNLYFLHKKIDTFEQIKDIIEKEGIIKSEKIIDQNLILVKNDIKIINNSLIELISNNPKLIYDVSPRKFEELVAELFYKEGYNVELTPATNDGGKDIYAYKKDAFNHYLFAVECKKYSKDNKIGRPIIDRLYGVVEKERLTGGILVTTSFFTKQAIEFSKQLSNRIFLNDYYNLIELINKHKIK